MKSLDFFLRVGRRGFLTTSLLTAMLITSLLWAYASCSTALSEHDEVAGAVLVVVPTLMVVFLARPGEHALSSRLLSGVRYLVLGTGVAATTAAVSLAGWHPFGDLAEMWLITAFAASIFLALLTISFLASLSPIDRNLRKMQRAVQKDRT